jgi:Flp pilus assembly protein TadG
MPMTMPTVKIRPSVSFRTERGTSLVEAAFIMPLLLLLTFSMVDFAVLFYAYLALENGVSQASRYAVTGNQGAGLSREQSIKKAMRQATPTLTIDDAAFTFSHLRPGQGTWDAGIGGPNDIDKVTVNYSWPLMTPLMRPFFTNGRAILTVESAMKNEARFQ